MPFDDEAPPPTDTDKSTKRKKTAIWLVLGFVLVLGVVVGVAIPLTRSDEDDKKSSASFNTTDEDDSEEDDKESSTTTDEISAPKILQSPPTITTARYAEFVFEGDGAASHECHLDNVNQGEYEPCESPVFYPDVGEGSHTFTVRSVDGTTVSKETSFSWQVINLFDNADSTNDLLSATRQPSPAEPNSWRGILRINCDLSHTSYNDPVVFPGVVDATHLHRFYGNTVVDHSTTMKSIYTQGESTCQGNKLNLSAYWIPALLAPSQSRVGDWQVVPAVVGGDDVAHEIFYYSAGVDDLDSIQPIPAGLRMVAGDPMATPENPQDTSIVRWHCQTWESSDGLNPQWSTTIPECLAPDRLRMDIFFPSCWNGVDLDSPDHKQHMAYPLRQRGEVVCPESHPVPVVRPSYHYAFGIKPDVFDVTTKTSKGWRLAADSYPVSANRPGGASLHADWFNGWHPAVMEAILKHCIQGGLDCHDGNLANGYRLSDVREGTSETPEIVNSGRGYHVEPF